MNIGAEAHQLDKVCVEGRNHEARTRNGDDQVDFVGTELGAFQALLGGFLPQLYGMFDVFVVRLREWPGLDRILDGKMA